MKKIVLPIMVAVLVLGGLGAGALQSDIKTTDSNVGVEKGSATLFGDERTDTHHTVFAEYGTGMGCPYCPYAHAALKQIYAGHYHPFYYVSLVGTYHTPGNVHADYRLNTEYNLAGFPTTYFDGGYLVRVGVYQSVPQMVSWYNSSIVTCKNRNVANITTDVSASWLGDATMNIHISVHNNEANRYAGRIRVYVTEIESTLWDDVWGNPYTFAFLDYAFNQDLSINAGDTWQDSTIWDGSLHNDGYGHNFGGITADNIMVITAVFNATGNLRYSDPPNNPFTAYFVDETAGSLVSTGVDPSQSFVTLTNENLPHLITCPAGDAPVYQNLKVTCKDGSGTPMPGIPSSAFTFTLGSIDAVWYGTLSCTFTAVDPQTDANGEIRFTVKGDTSIYGNMTIQATVQSVPLNDIDTLPCKSVDYDVNGQVSLGDFVTFASDYTKTVWRSDFSGDGQVTLGDFVTFAGHYTH